MKVRFDRIGYPLYCDAGPYEGDMRIDLTIKLYLSPEEYARYAGSESLQISLNDNDNGSGCLQTGNTAEQPGELSVGDVVLVGDTALACDPVGFREVAGDLNKVHVSKRGTHPDLTRELGQHPGFTSRLPEAGST